MYVMIRKMPHHIISACLQCLVVAQYFTGLLYHWLELSFVSKERCCIVLYVGQVIGTAAQDVKTGTQGLWRVVNFLVGMATRLTTGTTPVKSSESHNRTAIGIGYRGESIVPTRKLRRHVTCVTFCDMRDGPDAKRVGQPFFWNKALSTLTLTVL
jgi:hypothetical protein